MASGRPACPSAWPSLCSVLVLFLLFLSGCGGYLRDAHGTFSSPYYPGHYPPNINCTWEIEVRAVGGGAGGVREMDERERGRGRKGCSGMAREVCRGDELLGHLHEAAGVNHTGGRVVRGRVCGADLL